MGARTLEEKTQAFWGVSKAYNAPKPTLTVEQAIKTLGDIEDETFAQRRLAKHATVMLDEIIGVPATNTTRAIVYDPDWAA